ncbi:MAG: hypothetical protein AAF939_07675 [Planctomycetota bacterium]
MKRSVQKISPSRLSSFDEQFWPVLMAVTVLSGLAVGAILTLLKGPWMWGGLLILPVASATAIFGLSRLDNRRLKRTLQFAIICSLSAHLLVMVVASVVNIFGNSFQPKQPEVSQKRPIPNIQISDQKTKHVWEKPNLKETPETEVEQQRRVATTPNEPQTIPVKESKPKINPQIVRRKTPSTAVPKMARQLSKLRRQTSPVQPSTSQVENQFQNQKSETQTKPQKASPRSQANIDVQRQSPSQRTQSRQTLESKAATANVRNSVTELVRTPPNSRRARVELTDQMSQPKPTPSDARIRRSSPEIPRLTRSQPVKPTVEQPVSPKASENQPSKLADKITRRQVRDTQNRRSQNASIAESNVSPQISRSTQRKKLEWSQPTISSETSRSQKPRRAVKPTEIAVSPTPLESPQRNPESKTASRELQSRTVSISRSTAGLAGIGKAKNLDQMVGSQPSPAQRATDSSSRAKTMSSTQDNSVVSSTRSEFKRSNQNARTPTSSLKAEDFQFAKLAGSSQPADQTRESSAAEISSASTDHRDNLSAERGTARLDMGSPRIVRDELNSQRRGGGGQPEVGELNPARTQKSRERSETQPSLLADAGVEVAAPEQQSSVASASLASDLSRQDIDVTRDGREVEIAPSRTGSVAVDEMSDAGFSELAKNLADPSQRSRFTNRDSSADQEDQDDEKNRTGYQRSRITQAPITRSEMGLGLATTHDSNSEKSTKTGLANTESLAARLTRQATASLPGAGIGRTTSDVLLKAATSLPVIQPESKGRKNRAPVINSEATTGTVGSRKVSNERTRSSSLPSLSSDLQPSKLADNEGANGSNDSDDSRRQPDLSLEASTEIEPSRMSRSLDRTGPKLEIEAIEGPAGLGEIFDRRVGIVERPASENSDLIQPESRRYRKDTYGGMPAMNPDAVIAQEAFQDRNPASFSKSSEPTTEAAINLGLEFLARYQSGDGSWSLTQFDSEEPLHVNQLDSDTAATGLAVLAFQGAGYNHREFKYARQIGKAIEWLIDHQSEDGGLYVPSDKKSNNACRMYSHGIATLALTEAYGMTQDPNLREPAQKALDYIVETQDPKKGGWRYFANPELRSTDTSVTGWMMMSLKSGKLAGLEVRSEVFRGIDDWLGVASEPDSESVYRYNPFAVDSKGISRIQGRVASTSMTSVALLMRIYSGWRQSDPRLLAGVDYLLQKQMPGDNNPVQRDTYYWYYATQVLKTVGGERWEKWNDKLRPLLIRSQQKEGEMAGSWNPYRPVPDRWGQFGGRLYVTTMNLLSLEVRHRMIPIYQLDEIRVEGVIESGNRKSD